MNANCKTEHTEPLRQEIPSPLYTKLAAQDRQTSISRSTRMAACRFTLVLALLVAIMAVSCCGKARITTRLTRITRLGLETLNTRHLFVSMQPATLAECPSNDDVAVLYPYDEEQMTFTCAMQWPGHGDPSYLNSCVNCEETEDGVGAGEVEFAFRGCPRELKVVSTAGTATWVCSQQRGQIPGKWGTRILRRQSSGGDHGTLKQTFVDLNLS